MEKIKCNPDDKGASSPKIRKLNNLNDAVHETLNRGSNNQPDQHMKNSKKFEFEMASLTIDSNEVVHESSAETIDASMRDSMCGVASDTDSVLLNISSNPTMASNFQDTGNKVKRKKTERYLRIRDLTHESRGKIIDQPKNTHCFGTKISVNELLLENDSIDFVSEVQQLEAPAGALAATVDVLAATVDVLVGTVGARTAGALSGTVDAGAGMIGVLDGMSIVLAGTVGVLTGSVGARTVHVIFNEAGSGKSFYITWLANYLQEICPSWWIIKINLYEYSTDFEQLKTEEQRRKTAQKLANALELSYGYVKLNESLVKNWLPNELLLLKLFERKSNDKQLVILMDGFDEIAPDYKLLVCELLFTLTDFDGICKLYLSSRPYVMLIIPMLEKYINLEEESISKRIIDECEKAFDLLTMMESVVDKKLNIFNIEKTGSTYNSAKTPAAREREKAFKQDFVNNHTLLALYAVFDEHAIKMLLSNTQIEKARKCMENVHEGSEKSGFIEGIVNGAPIFNHRLFAEYFASLWFHSHTNDAIVKDFLKRKVYDADERVEITQFLDRMICKNLLLHTAILDCSNSKIKHILNETPNSINKKDPWGRTPLQLAVFNYRSQIFKDYSFHYLLNKTVDTKGTDKEGRNLLHLAAKYGDLNFVKCLREYDE
ncbi:uncharacterized protein LOC131285654 [Anopheles ziemanni]|uniref:uncharacterized protein LOC131285654 n=1 Tax=Anopheles ziemanni TaxID=345580 RepID=UPI00265F4888|nr:uncharacterized protein LOC131285654 [Anopheles ziemanni]